MVLFPNGIQGLADSIWQGVRGSAYRLVGIDYRSKPGIIKAHQKLTKNSPASGANEVNELCKTALPLSDGSTLWFSSTSGKVWRELADAWTLLGTLAIPGYDYKLTNTAFVGSYDYSAEVNIPFDHAFGDGGTKFYVQCNSTGAGPGSGNSGEIFEYDLSTAYDVTTATYVDFFAGDQQALCIFFKPDGTKFYVAEDGGTTSVIEYDLSTDWDITTASASGDTYDFSTEFDRACAIQFKPDGTEMYLTDLSEKEVYRYTLSTAWDVTTASHTSTFDMTSLTEITQFDAAYGGLSFSDDGRAMVVTSSSTVNAMSGGENIIKCELTTAWDPTTAVYRSGFDLPSGRDFGVTFYENLDGVQGFVVGEQNGPESAYDYTLGEQGNADADLAVTVLGAGEHGVADGEDGAIVQYVYFSTENWTMRIDVDNVTDLVDIDENGYISQFANGDDTYHPYVVQNNRLFIGDKYVIASVTEAGVFNQQTSLNVQSPERITILEEFDTDLLVGTKTIDGNSRVLRWDTESESWYGQDTVYEDEIHAFIRDDNYVYAQVGDFGQMFLYDGEKLLLANRIPGDYSPTSRCKVNSNAVGYLMGIPVFGVSNLENNGTLQGVYSYGRYSKDYNITLDLSFPISTDVFADVEIGAIVIQGADMYVAWKSGSSPTYGVDKLDWTAKYANAYIETTVLNNPEDRSKFKALDSVTADYYQIPANTSVDMAYRKNYGSYIDIPKVVDAKLLQIRGKKTVKEMGAIQTRFDFNVNGNDSPEIENFAANFEGET